MVLINDLSNGMKLICEKMPYLKSVSIAFCIKVGARDENSSNYGISHFLEHMLFKGTASKTSFNISEIVDKIGGELNAFTSKEMTVIHITVLDGYVETAIELLCDIFLNSQFANEELEKEKGVIIEEIKMYEDVPEDLIHETNINNFLKNSNLSNTVLGNIQSVKNIDQKKVLDYYSNYSIKSTFISVAGNIDSGRVISLFEKYIGNFKRDGRALREKNENVTLNIDNQVLKRDSHQVHLCANTKGSSYSSDDMFKLSLISNLLGGGMSSRIFQEVREKRGLAYSVYTYLSCYKEIGIFTTYAGTNYDNYKEVLDIVYKEYENLYKFGISEDELSKAKNQIISGLVMDLESSKTLMFRNMNLYFATGEILPLNKIVKRVRKITLDDISQVCSEYFSQNFYSHTIVGNI